MTARDITTLALMLKDAHEYVLTAGYPVPAKAALRHVELSIVAYCISCRGITFDTEAFKAATGLHRKD